MTSENDTLLIALREAAVDESKAVAFLEARRWGSDPACPRCGSVAVYQMKDAKTGQRNKDFRWRCRDCERMYSVRTGTVFEETRLPLRHWCHAYWRACASKKGVSALQISRELGCTYKSALFLMHRIRWAVTTVPGEGGKLAGTVEADETYVGGKLRWKNNQQTGTYAKNSDRFTAVLAAVQRGPRGGRVRATAVAKVTKDNVRKFLADNVDFNSRLMTDEGKSYVTIGRQFRGGHETVVHKRHEYVRGDAHTNTIENFFGCLKRKLYGTHHAVSKEHLHRYVSEAAYLYNTRDLHDVERVGLAVKSGEGKRLLYREPKSDAA